MKKLLTFLVVFVLISSAVIAQGSKGTSEGGTGASGEETVKSSDTELEQDASKGQKGIDEPETGAEEKESGQGQQVQTEQETQNLGEESTIMVQQRQQLRAQTKEELKQMVQQRKQEMNQELTGLGKNKEKVYKNQNQVRLAVHSLLAMGGLVGGIGPQVREIARNFNNSVQATIRAEEKIQIRSGFLRFFAGGDDKAAGELEQEINQNRQRIQQLNQLREQCDCDEEVKAMMREQIQNMEQEQNRLQQLAQKEKKSKGIFGWLWK